MNERPKGGFTILELVIVMSIMLLMAGIAVPKISTTIRHNRVNRAAMVVAGDLRTAFSVAARQRAPVKVTVTTSTQTYTIADRLSNTTIRSRALGSTSEYKLSAITFLPSQIEIFPNGVSSNNLIVTVTGGDYSRQITASTAGLVRTAQ